MDLTRLVQQINALRGTRCQPGEPFEGGEQGAVALLEDGVAVAALKRSPFAGAAERSETARAVTERLAERGYPVPRYLAVGTSDGFGWSVQSLLPGRPLRRVAAAALPALFALNDLQAGAWPGESGNWPALLVESVLEGLEGFCVIASLSAHSAEAARLLERLQRVVTTTKVTGVPTGDVTHFDFNPTNILTQNDAISGVIDWDGTLAGDRAFDLATLLFYGWDEPDARALLERRLDALASRDAVALYLAHLIVRQVDWSIRHHAEAVTRHWLERGTRVAATLDIGR